MYQRQVVKGDLAAVTLATSGSAATGRQFTKDDLRDLFTLAAVEECETRELCKGLGQQPLRWLDPDEMSEEAAPHLAAAIAAGVVTAAGKVLKREMMSVVAPLPSEEEDEGDMQLLPPSAPPPVLGVSVAAAGPAERSTSRLWQQLQMDQDEEVCLEDSE